jgi:hypothetical protein
MCEQRVRVRVLGDDARDLIDFSQQRLVGGVRTRFRLGACVGVDHAAIAFCHVSTKIAHITRSRTMPP